MKILAARFANINSLKGGFEIDFTDPGLAGPGIFAIIGHTGSGKTTILDAITLALYARTPRLSLSKSENELMTRGAGFCRAEVDFETDVSGRSIRFRSTWLQHRARNSPEGALQAPKMQLVQLSEKLPGDDWETAKLSHVPKQVEDVTGLDFDRFARTCLLAQGRFAAFLEAKDDERAQVLEQITGAEIYSEISLAAFRRDKEEAAGIDALSSELKGVTIVSGEEFGALEEKTAQLDQRRKTVETGLQLVKKNIEWYKSLAALLEARRGLEAEQQQLVRERETRAADLLRLADGRRAEPVRMHLIQRDQRLARRCRHEAELAETRNRIPEALAGVAAAELAYGGAVEAAVSFRKQAEMERIRIREARDLDQQLKSLRSACAETGRQRNELQEKDALLQRQIAELNVRIAEMASRRQIVSDILERSAVDQQLGGDLRMLENLATQRNQIREKIAGSDRDIAEADKGLQQFRGQDARLAENIESESGHLAATADELTCAAEALETAFPGGTANSLQEALRAAERRLDAAQALQSFGAEMRAHTASERGTQTAVKARAAEIEAADREVVRLEQEREALEGSVEALNERRAAGLAAVSFDEHRRLLHEGKPCPLCGALEHPYAAGVGAVDTEVKEVEKLLKKAKAGLKKTGEALRAATTAANRLSTQQAADQSSLNNHRSNATGLREKWLKPAALLETGLLPEDEAGIDALAEQCEAGRLRAASAVGTFQTAVERRDAAEKKIQELRNRLHALEKEQAGVRGTIEKLDALGRDARDRKTAQEKERENADAELFRELLVYGVVEFDDDVMPSLRTRWESRQKVQREFEEIGSGEQAARSELTAADSRLAELARHLQERSGRLAEQEREIAETSAKRHDLFGARDPDAEEKRLQQEESAGRKREEESSQGLQEARLVQARVQAAEEQQTAALNASTKDFADAVRMLEEALAAAGFADEAAVQAALLPADVHAALCELEKRFDESAVRLQGSLAHVGAQIAGHEAARPTDCSPEELEQQEKLLAEQVDEAMCAWQEQWKLWSIQKENRDRYRSLGDRIQAAERSRERWIKLCELIGSHDGRKFRDYAHGLTFATLVSLANQQMEKLNGRYRLANQGLELQIIDRYIADTRASVKNLSGGEKFLASLALALGLAQMVGRKHRMDTLFIDEGFGALDPDTLETAVAALCGLQQQGKLIGVISHVESLKERLPARLEVVRTGAGISTISGPGCRATR